ncbi:GNAT family N-acetyltransferase [Actinokineospora auranticolor]|uniref:Ribosomal protein S18 acetylase RimI-like enzyme n=1 Tax=Actinokineospora auranticolor TaxID=155976 RepID=A0A2S6GGR2_9PSEU|nr:GNAT family N-acetyltransferase [Actinokineospora auranticolor]PPK64381.1 ribosomal protein S18 acetylase RimI-like enzyme [Actinokineospora auranticolor]
MYAIRAATPADRPGATALLARAQAVPEQHVGYHGVTVEEITAELAAVRPTWASGAAVGVDGDGVVRAVLSVDVDREVGRAWLYGPFVEVPDGHPAERQVWHNTADDLLDVVLRTPALAGITDLELYGHRRNRRLGDFAARHGFAAGSASRVFTLTGAALRSALVGLAEEPGCGPVRLGKDPLVRRQVGDLHERCFPNRTVSARQLVEGARGHTVVTLTGVDGLIGYAAGFIQEEEFSVDYVAVDPNMRSAGAGRSLVRALLRELAAEHGARGRAAAVIALGNDASERMFTALGFDLHLELVGYRRQEPAAGAVVGW